MDITSSRNPWNQSPWHPHPAGSRDQHPPEQDLRNSRQNPFSTRTLPELTSCANRRPSLSFVPQPKDFSGLSLRKVQTDRTLRLHAAVSACRRMEAQSASVQHSSTRKRTSPRITG